VLKWYREPLVHFLFLGTILFFISGSEDSFQFSDTEHEIVIDSQKIKDIKLFWKNRYHTPPTQEELNTTLGYYVENEILYREAAKLNLDKNDKAIQQIMVQRLKNLMHESNSMDLSDSALKKFFQDNKASFADRVPHYLTFGQIYFNPKNHKNPEAIAKKTYEKIKSQPYTKALSQYGDKFYAGANFSHISTKALSEYFSHAFIKQLLSLPSKQWSKPIKSGFGVHLIYISQKNQDTVNYDMLKEAVKTAYTIEEGKKNYEKNYEKIKRDYKVIREPSLLENRE